MTQISISDIQRNLHKLNDFEIIEVVDKKRNKVKGYFIEGKYASFVEEVAQKLKSLKKSRPTADGMLSHYAQPEKIAGEKGAWRRHIITQYAQEQEA